MELSDYFRFDPDRALLINLTFWTADAGGDVLVDEHVEADVVAHAAWHHVVARAIEANCAGLECLSGIPSTVGGTPVQNVGAYGQEVSETRLRMAQYGLAGGRADRKFRTTA